MKYLKIKDFNTRFFFKKQEKIIKLQKFLFINAIHFLRNKNLSSKKMLYLFLKKNKNLRLASKVRIIRRCIFSNRNRSVLQMFSLSRITLRTFINFGIIPGYKKSVY